MFSGLAVDSDDDSDEFEAFGADDDTIRVPSPGRRDAAGGTTEGHRGSVEDVERDGRETWEGDGEGEGEEGEEEDVLSAELSAAASMYGSDFTRLSRRVVSLRVRPPLASVTDANTNELALRCTLVITYPRGYPNVPAKVNFDKWPTEIHKR